MSDLSLDEVSRYEQTHARCLAAQERAKDVLGRAVTALKVAEDRLKRAQAAQAAALKAGRYANRNGAIEYAAPQETSQTGLS